MHYGVVNIVDEINGETCIHYRGFEVGNAEPIVQVHKCRPWVVKGSRTEEISSCATKRIEDEELCKLIQSDGTCAYHSHYELFSFALDRICIQNKSYFSYLVRLTIFIRIDSFV